MTPAASDHFDLAYVRSQASSSQPPIVVVPGGPGLGSILPYTRFRRDAQRRGLDVVMMEHRGVGISRHTDAGDDLPPEAVTLEQSADDLAAVLDHAGIDRAVIYGSSYGTYLAQLFGLRHPGRVAGMVLDSPVLRADDHERQRDHLRSLLWDGERAETARAADLLRRAVETGRIDGPEATQVVQPVYEFAGARTLERLLELRLAGRGARLWDGIARLGERELSRTTPYVMEFDLVGRIAFRELGWAPAPDGKPLDVQLPIAGVARRFPAFEREPADLAAALPQAGWPLAVVSGERDLRCPRPVAEEIVAGAPDAVLVPLAGTGHSALDTHRAAALHVAHAVQVGGHRRLPDLAPRIATLPHHPSAQVLPAMLKAAVTAHLPRPGTR